MAYSDFDLKKVRHDFGLQIAEQPDLFADVPPVQPGPMLVHTLAETAYLAIAINTEKARSEMLITPVLLEIWRQAQFQVSLFSGTEFTVDEARGLTGYCDYILSRSKEQLTVNAPVVMIVRIGKTHGILAPASRERALRSTPGPPASGHVLPTALATRPALPSRAQGDVQLRFGDINTNKKWDRIHTTSCVAQPCRYGLEGTRQLFGLWEYRT